MGELTVKKIFEELIVMSSRIECNKDRFVIKSKDRGYEYDLGSEISGWIELMEQQKIEIEAGVKYSWDNVLSKLSVE